MMDLRDHYKILAHEITDADLHRAAALMAEHIGKASAITKAELTSALFGKTTDSTERKARELNDRAYSLFNVRLPSRMTISRVQEGLF